MKKLFHGSILATFVLLAGCQGAFQPYDGGGYYYKPDDYGHPGYGSDGQMTQMGGNHRGSRPKPQPYSVTPKDESKYQDLNDQIDQRLEKIHSSETTNQSQGSSQSATPQASQTSSSSSTTNTLPPPGSSN